MFGFQYKLVTYSFVNGSTVDSYSDGTETWGSGRRQLRASRAASPRASGASSFGGTFGSGGSSGAGGGLGSFSYCKGCVVWTMRLTQSITIFPTMRFRSYPFDYQEFRIRFDLGAGVEFVSCESMLTNNQSYLAFLVSSGSLKRLLPTTEEFTYAIADGVTATHPILNGEKNLEMCDLTIRVTRDYAIIFIKLLVPTVIAVYLGLMSVLLSADDHCGDRAALLGVSILICMINLERDLGLGKLMYSTWFDIMNIVQLCIQVIAFFEVLVEHALIKRGKEAECQALNRVFAWFIMVVGYPATVLATIFFGMNFTWSALACVMLIMVAAMYAVFECRRFLTAGDRRRKNLAKLLSETDSRSPEFMEVFTEAFEAHDLDSEPKSRMQRPRLRPIPPLPSSIPRPLANVRTYAL